MTLKKSRILLAVAAALATGDAAWADGLLAIKGGKVVPVAGEAIAGATVLVRDGRIAAIGKDVAIPTEARVVDATGKVVLPGFIEAHSPRGVEQSNERNANVPFVSVIDALDPMMEYFEECRRNGVTTIAAVPGNDTMIGGQAAAVKTAGTYIDQMVLKRQLGIKISLLPTADRSRMSHLAALRKELDAARDANRDEGSRRRPGPATDGKDAPKKSDAPAADQKGPPAANAGTPDPSQAGGSATREALQRLLKGELKAFIYCDNAMDVNAAIRITRDYGLKSILCLGPNSYKAARQVAASGLPVVLEPTLVFWENDPRTGEDKQVILPQVYREAGVPLTFQTTGFAGGNLFRAAALPPTVGTNYLWFQAATAVKYGMPAAEAVESITLRPAKLLGIEKLVGSLEVGKDADLVILSGEPLKLDTWVETTIVGGNVVYERAKDTKLQKLLNPPKEQ